MLMTQSGQKRAKKLRGVIEPTTATQRQKVFRIQDKKIFIKLFTRAVSEAPLNLPIHSYLSTVLKDTFPGFAIILKEEFEVRKSEEQMPIPLPSGSTNAENDAFIEKVRVAGQKWQASQGLDISLKALSQNTVLRPNSSAEYIRVTGLDKSEEVDPGKLAELLHAKKTLKKSLRR